MVPWPGATTTTTATWTSCSRATAQLAYLSPTSTATTAGAFTDVGAGLAGVDQGSVAWGDYDNDGDLDILLTGYRRSWRACLAHLPQRRRARSRTSPRA